MIEQNQHVVSYGKGQWAVKPENDTDVMSIHPTQAAAIERARVYAQSFGTELVIHRKDGKVSRRQSFRRDPASSEELD